MRRAFWETMSRRMRRKHNCDYRTPGICLIFPAPSVPALSWIFTLRVTGVARAAAAVKGLRRASINYAPDSGRCALDGHPRFGLRVGKATASVRWFASPDHEAKDSPSGFALKLTAIKFAERR